MDSNDEAMVYMLESFDLSEVGTGHKMIKDALRESKDCIGITSMYLRDGTDNFVAQNPILFHQE